MLTTTEYITPYDVYILPNEAFYASTYITVLVHIGTMLQKYPHKINKAVHTCPEQWCVAVLKEKNIKLLNNVPISNINISYVI